jgi:hypothetical protein
MKYLLVEYLNGQWLSFHGENIKRSLNCAAMSVKVADGMRRTGGLFTTVYQHSVACTAPATASQSVMKTGPLTNS